MNLYIKVNAEKITSKFYQLITTTTTTTTTTNNNNNTSDFNNNDYNKNYITYVAVFKSIIIISIIIITVTIIILRFRLFKHYRYRVKLNVERGGGVGIPTAPRSHSASHCLPAQLGRQMLYFSPQGVCAFLLYF